MTLYVEAAIGIARRLVRDSVWSGGQCTWVGPSMEPRGGDTVVLQRACGADAYSGTSGIALFLAAAYAAGSDPVLYRTAAAALAHAEATLLRMPALHGYHGGMPGAAAHLVRAGVLLGDDRFVDAGVKVLDAFLNVEQAQDGLDIVSGSAGTLLAALEVWSVRPEDRFLEAAIRCGRHLVSTAEKTEIGWSWNTLPGMTRRHLLGMAHGASGIAHALLELHAVAGEADFRRGALEGFRYERRWFDPEKCNWPDFRSSVRESSFMTAWCHGAAGIGLCRLRLKETGFDDSASNEAMAAVATTTASLRRAAEGNYSLCHGHLGNMELLLCAGVDEMVRIAILDEGVDRYHRRRYPWPCGIAGAGESPGFMLGLAGIGYMYLRANDPLHVPSTLLPGPSQQIVKSQAMRKTALAQPEGFKTRIADGG